MVQLLPVIDKKFILDRISQEEIFEKYLGEPVHFSTMYLSPLRSDRRPTCSFKYVGKALCFKDWNGHFSGDCFNFVQALHSDCGFYEACRIIAEDFNLIKGNQKGKSFKRHPKPFLSKTGGSADIKVKWRSFERQDIEYWSQFGIDIPALNKFNIAPVSHVWVNGEVRYSYRTGDPAYAYWFDKDNIKVYFPLRDNYRFLGNSSLLQGYDQLPKEGNVLFVTKSMKDVALLYVLGYPSVAPQSESSILTEEQHVDLSSRFKSIITFYDFDLTGVRSANKMKKLYGYRYIFLTNGRYKTKDYGAKDPSDLFKTMGILSLNEFLLSYTS